MHVEASVLVTENATIKEVLEVIERNEDKIAVVTDPELRVIGLITDGDIRRGLISGMSLSNVAADVMNTNPILAILGEDLGQYFKDIENNLYKHIIVVTCDGKFHQVISKRAVTAKLGQSFQAVIMAGGKGSRLGDITKDIPKPMVEVGGKPMIEHLINKLRIHGYKKLIIAVNYKKEVIKDYIQDGKRFGVEVEYLEEPQFLGTAGALSLLPDTVQDTFMVINADLVTNCDFLALMMHHKVSQNIATVCVREYKYQIPFGVIEIDESCCIKGIIEKPINKFLVSSGIYILDKKALKYLPHNQHLDMPELIQMLVKYSPVNAFTVFESWYDVGRVEDLSHVREIFNV